MRVSRTVLTTFMKTFPTINALHVLVLANYVILKLLARVV